MNQNLPIRGQILTHREYGSKFVVEDIEEPKGGPQARRYVLKHLGRWLALRQPLLLSSLSEEYVLNNFTITKELSMTNNKVLFNTGAPGFLYAVIVFVLGLFASWGVSFPKEVSILGMDIITSLSTGGVWAIVGILVTSIAFPIFNWYKSGGKLNFSFIFGKDSNLLALIYAVMSGVALTGFVLPDGTIESILGAVKIQDWGTLGALIFGPVLDTLRRWLKERKKTIEIG